MDQSVEIKPSPRPRDPAGLLFLCSYRGPHSALPGLHQGDAEIQQRGAPAQEGWSQPPGYSDADADEALQGSEELLYCRVGTQLQNKLCDCKMIISSGFPCSSSW